LIEEPEQTLKEQKKKKKTITTVHSLLCTSQVIQRINSAIA